MQLLNNHEETIILNQNNKGKSWVLCKIAKQLLVHYHTVNDELWFRSKGKIARFWDKRFCV